MKEPIIFIFTVVVMTLLASCSTGPLKAPCDQYGSFCGTKTKINAW